MKPILSCIVSAVISTILVIILSLLESYGNDFHPSGPEAAFAIPMLVIYLLISGLLVHPTMLAAANAIGNIAAAIFISIFFASAIAALFYDPEVDTSFIKAILIFIALLGIPWMFGGLIGKYVVNYFFRKMPNQSLKSGTPQSGAP